MADTFSSILRLRMQQTGANTNTWGALLNTASAQLLEDAIAGAAAITVAGSAVTLTTNNGANDQARMFCLSLSGSPGVDRTVIVPTKTKLYLVDNNSNFQQTVKTAAGTGVPIPAGGIQFVYCDGTNVVFPEAAVPGGAVATATNALQLGGVLAALYARRDQYNSHTAGFSTAFNALVDAATVVLDCASSNKFYVELAGNRVLSITNAHDGQDLEIWFQQDAGGNRTITWPANVYFDTGASPTLSTAADAIDRFKLTYHLGLNIWIASSLLNGQIGGTSTSNIAISGSQLNVRPFLLAGSPGGIVTLNVFIPTGSRVMSLMPGEAALDLSGFASGSTINLVNNGIIMGAGGRGGKGGAGAANGSADYAWGGELGEAGGNAINGPGTGVTFNITNAAGRILGGGGGGGGGGGSVNNGANLFNGGGGGGGAGGGRGGRGGQLVFQENTTGTQAAAGGNGTLASSGGVGSGGAGTQTGSASGGAGGAGGDWGDPGAAGGSPTTFGIDASGGVAGAAGKAVELNGGTHSFVSGGSSPNVKGAVS